MLKKIKHLKKESLSIALATILILSPYYFLLQLQFEVAVATVPPRNLNLYILNCNDATDLYVGNRADIIRGVKKAVEHARDTRLSQVTLTGDTINIQYLNSTEDLEDLMMNPPPYACIINTHGEVLPIPASFIQNDAGTGCDAPNTWWEAAPIGFFTTYNGWLGSWDTCDFYKATLDMPYRNYNVTVVGTENFGLRIYDPRGYLYYVSDGPGFTETIIFQIDWIWIICPIWGYWNTGDWRCEVFTADGARKGDYTLTVTYPQCPPGGGGCPQVYTWNGTVFGLDKNILPLGKNSSTDVHDWYKLENPLEMYNNSYNLMFMESEDVTSLNSVELLAIDHSSDFNIALTGTGEILTYRNPIPPSIARTKDSDVLYLINETDDLNFDGKKDDFMVIGFGSLKKIGPNPRLILRTDFGDYEKLPYSIYIEVMTRPGATVSTPPIWKLIKILEPRDEWAYDAVKLNLDDYDIATDKLWFRFRWTCENKLDYVGIETGPNDEFTVKRLNFVRGFHGNGSDITNALSASDTDNVILKPYGKDTVSLVTFEGMQEPVEGEVRDFVLHAVGHYTAIAENSTRTQLETLMVSLPTTGTPAFDDYIDRFGDYCRKFGWTYASTVGYPLYYVSNTERLGSDKVFIGEPGLQRFLMDPDILCHYFNSHIARIGYDFQGRVRDAYPDLPEYVSISRPLNTFNLPWDGVGYTDTDGGWHSLASVVMNGSSCPGLFIHNGLDLKPARNETGSSATPYDDFLNGYLATAMAIEELRTNILLQLHSTDCMGEEFTAVWGVRQVACGWGEEHNGAHYRFYDLLIPVTAAYKENWQTYVDPKSGKSVTWHFWLSLSDFRLEAIDPRITFEILNVAKENPDDTSLMDDIGWWHTAAVAGNLGEAFTGFPLGDLIGLIPILKEALFPSPPDFQKSGPEVWAYGISADEDGNDDGTSWVLVRVFVEGLENDQPNDYLFEVTSTAWVSAWNDGGVSHPRFAGLTLTETISLHVDWRAPL